MAGLLRYYGHQDDLQYTDNPTRKIASSPFLRGNWLFLKVALDLLFLKLREAAYVHRLTNSNKLVFGSNIICIRTRESHAKYLSRPPDALKSLIRLYVGLRTGYDLGYIAV